MDPVEIPIDGVLDLHAFSPKEVPSLVDEYIHACLEKDILQLRIIHGKGKGVQKARVQSILAAHPNVGGFTDAPPDAGGWGATLVTLHRPASTHKS